MSGSRTYDRTQSSYQRGHQQTADRAQQREEGKAVAAVFDSQVKTYEELLPTNISLETFRNAFTTAIQRRPSLLQADRNSLWLALQQCASDGLMPDNREAALVIFNEDDEDESGNRVSRGNRPKQVVYMPMVRGLRKLCRNTGNIASIDATVVYKGELIKIWREDGQKHFEHQVCTDPDFDDSPSNIIGAYAIVSYKDGGWEGEWMSRAKIERVRAVSRAQRGPWNGWYDEMSRKTVLRRLLKQLDSSPEVRSLEDTMSHDPTMGPDIDGEVTEVSDSQPAPRRPAQPEARHQRSDPPAHEERPTQTAGGWVGRDGEVPRRTQSAPPPPEPIKEPLPPHIEQWSAWLVDEGSAEVGDEPIAGYLPWAEALSDLCAKRQEHAALILENNEPAMLEAKEGDEFAAAVIQRIVDDLNRTAEVSEPDKGVLAVPMASGKPHWPDYLTSAFAELNACQTAEEVRGWVDRNRKTYTETYPSPSTERAVHRYATNVMAKLELPGDPRPEPPPFDEVDDGSQQVERLRKTITEIPDAAELYKFWMGQITAKALREFPARKEEVAALFNQRHHEITGQQGRFR